MERIPEKPLFELSQQQIEDFWRDGIICVRQLYLNSSRNPISCRNAFRRSMCMAGLLV